MQNNLFLRAAAVAVVGIVILLNSADAQVTYEYRSEVTPAGTPYTVQIEVNPVVGERPATIYAIDTDGVNGIDIWTNDPEACTKVKPVECQSLSNNDSTIIFKDKSGEDNIRLTPKVTATF